MSLVNGIFSEKMIFSLGWTFINSLWQGGFICIVNWIILLMLSKQSARLRYIVSTVSLFAVLAFAVWTFFVLSDYYNVYFAVANSVSGSALKNPAHNGVFDLFLLQVIPLNTSEYF